MASYSNILKLDDVSSDDSLGDIVYQFERDRNSDFDIIQEEIANNEDWSDLSDNEELMIPATNLRGGTCIGRVHFSRRDKRFRSSAKSGLEEVPPVGWIFGMTSDDVAFDERKTGPSEDIRNEESALSYLMKFLGLNFFENLVSSSMAYQRSKDMDLVVDEDDIKAYIGAIIFMSINPMYQISHYWSNNERRHISYMSSRISCRRFREISKIFHVSIPSQEVSSDRLRKVRPFLNVLERNFAKLYIPNPCVSIDEDTIAYKGRLSFKRHLPAKPPEYGIKFFAICDAVTGYCMRFEIYCGKGAVSRGGKVLTSDLVHKLISSYVDIHVASTIADSAADAEIQNDLRCARPKITSATANNNSKYSGGVDKFEKLRNYYPSGHHTEKWWKMLFFNLLDMAITNAHICHKLKFNTSLIDFRDQLVDELFDKVDLRKKRSAIDDPSSCGPPISSFNDHVLVNSGKLVVCLLCSQQGRRAPKGAIRTKFKCLKCNKGFCSFSKRDCFINYHNNL